MLMLYTDPYLDMHIVASCMPKSHGRTCNTPPQNRRRNPNKSANKSADQFFGKTGSQCPGSQSQAPNTPSLWLLNSCSHVETQNISQFSKKNFRLSVSTWSLSTCLAVHSGGPVVYANIHIFIGVGSIPTAYRLELFGHFFSLVFLRKLVLRAQTKRCWKKINAHRLPICIPLCAGWVCSTHLRSSLSLYMVPELS